MPKKGKKAPYRIKPTLFSAAREGNLADLVALLEDPEKPANIDDIFFIFTDSSAFYL